MPAYSTYKKKKKRKISTDWLVNFVPREFLEPEEGTATPHWYSLFFPKKKKKKGKSDQSYGKCQI